MTINQTLDSLLADPSGFLQANALVIYGSSKGASGRADFVLQASEETGWRSCVGGPMRDVPLYVMYEADGFYGKGVGDKSRELGVHYVSMREFNAATGTWEDVATTHYVLPTDGPAVMVTSKLNGCTFGIGSSGNGARLVSHLRPPGGDLTARKRLDQGTRAGFAGGTLDVSLMSSGTQNATIFAARTGAGWTFYAQRFQMLANMRGFINGVQVYQ